MFFHADFCGVPFLQKNARKLAIWSKMVWVLNLSRELLCSMIAQRELGSQNKQNSTVMACWIKMGISCIVQRVQSLKTPNNATTKCGRPLATSLKKIGYDFGMTGFPKWCSNFCGFRFHIEERSSFRFNTAVWTASPKQKCHGLNSEWTHEENPMRFMKLIKKNPHKHINPPLNYYGTPQASIMCIYIYIHIVYMYMYNIWCILYVNIHIHIRIFIYTHIDISV